MEKIKIEYLVDEDPCKKGDIVTIDKDIGLDRINRQVAKLIYSSKQEEAKYFASKRLLENEHAYLEEGVLNVDEIIVIPKEHQDRYFKENPDKIRLKEEREKELQHIVLPQSGKLISTFANEVSNIIKDKNTLFFRNDTRQIIEIGTIETKQDGKVFTGFIDMKPSRFITLAEKYFIPGQWVFMGKEEGMQFKFKSMSRDIANTLLQSEILQNNLPVIERIFTVPLPIIKDGKLTFPNKGYDPRFNSWLPHNTPNINTNLSLEESKVIIYELLKDFCFQTHQDYINAISALITPYLKGLFKRFCCRMPLFFYVANRERAGKDYLAGITGILYEGVALEEPPICNAEKKSNNNDELKKKILSAFLSGRKRLHFSNNKGYMDNAVFEGILTAEKWGDRILGKNEAPNFDNEIDFTMSGNIGIGFTPDIANRSRFIRLFLDIEDANNRNFSNPDLHGYVRENRGLILSAIYSLINNWVEKGCPGSSLSFASFPEWARVCGGIMETAGYENPCQPDRETLSIGGDTETADMKKLFEICYEQYSNKPLSKYDIKDIISKEGIFSYFDFENRSDQVKFGNKLIKFIGRVLSGIRLKIKDKSVRTARYEFIFTRDTIEVDKHQIFGETCDFGNVGNLGNLYHSKHVNENI